MCMGYCFYGLWCCGGTVCCACRPVYNPGGNIELVCPEFVWDWAKSPGAAGKPLFWELPAGARSPVTVEESLLTIADRKHIEKVAELVVRKDITQEEKERLFTEYLLASGENLEDYRKHVQNMRMDTIRIRQDRKDEFEVLKTKPVPKNKQ